MKIFCFKAKCLLTLFFLISSPGFFAQTVTNIDTGEVFATVDDALEDPDTLDGQTLSLSSGTFVENVFLIKSVNIVGAGSGLPGGSLIQGSVFIQSGGTPGNPIRLEDFQVSAPDNSGLVFRNMPGIAHYRVENVAALNCGANGVLVATTDFELNDATFINCEFSSAQVGQGFRVHTGGQTRNITLMSCTFRNNFGPGVLVNGASLAPAGFADNWLISDCTFENNSIDPGRGQWGGGVWVVSTGGGSITDILFENSTFIDNGGFPPRAAGVVVATRANGTTANVRFEGCQFLNSPGMNAQEFGVDIYNEPGSLYQPLRFSDCHFQNLRGAIAAESEFETFGTMPTVFACTDRNTFTDVQTEFLDVINPCMVPTLSTYGLLIMCLALLVMGVVFRIRARKAGQPLT